MTAQLAAPPFGSDHPDRSGRTAAPVATLPVETLRTLANPAVQVAIVGTRNASHVEEAAAAAEIHLDDEVMDRIDQIMADATPVAGPPPETM